MYSRILIAVEDSDISRLAIKEAIKLAKDQRAKLCIIYVADEFIPAGEGVHVDFKEHELSKRKQGRAILNEMVKIARHEKVNVESHLIEVTESNSHIPGKIIEEATKWKADLIVLGTHGRSGLSRLLLGSITEEIIRNTQIPVHVIRGED